MRLRNLHISKLSVISYITIVALLKGEIYSFMIIEMKVIVSLRAILERTAERKMRVSLYKD